MESMALLLAGATIGWFFYHRQQLKENARQDLYDRCEKQGIHPLRCETLVEVQRHFYFPINQYLTAQELADYKRQFDYQYVSQYEVDALVSLIRQRHQANPATDSRS